MQKVSNLKVARSYALAWFDVASKRHEEDKVFSETQRLLSDIEKNPQVWNMLYQPIDNEQFLVKIITDVAKTFDFLDVTTQTLKLLAENRHLNLLKDVLVVFKELYYQEKNIINVIAESAVLLSDKQDKALKDVLSEKLKANINIEYIINPEVLGGLRINYQSFEIDDTLRTKVRRIKQFLKTK